MIIYFHLRVCRYRQRRLALIYLHILHYFLIFKELFVSTGFHTFLCPLPLHIPSIFLPLQSPDKLCSSSRVSSKVTSSVKASQSWGELVVRSSRLAGTDCIIQGLRVTLDSLNFILRILVLLRNQLQELLSWCVLQLILLFQVSLSITMFYSCAFLFLLNYQHHKGKGSVQALIKFLLLPTSHGCVQVLNEMTPVM